MSKDEIFEKLKNILVSVFEIEADDITPDALLGDDLDLDSIDAIDLVVKMKEYTPEGKPAIDASIFKEVKTVQDVVDALAKVWA
ncbi:MAG: acyl carrier protein [Treponema sp.]|nr:acyl carrier protein [Spirochaetia bacterium]MDD7460490.1 acyl carrier protein [Spirochaetales bacterium]MDY5812036.1 acyl carrier protein [Treponema sp.]MEE1181327.1 acyl carrier protein [Treponema sp.]